MKKLSQQILKFKNLIIILFTAITILNLFLIDKVTTNYDLSDYLPEEVESLTAAKEVIKAYGDENPDIKLVIPEVSMEEAMFYKQEIINVEGVKQVLWVDDYVNLEEMAYMNPTTSASLLEEWYQDENALFLIRIDHDKASSIIKNIRGVTTDKTLLAGDIIETIEAQENVTIEMNRILLFVVPIIVVILLLTTSSWFEPFLFFLTIVAAIIINMGTNLILGEISFITQAAVVVLQLAVSMDYAIFLLHRFASIRETGKNVKEAMTEAMSDSVLVIIGSALTTILGFLALTLMKFKIGADLGLVLAKGIILSFISVILLLPNLAVLMHKFIDKTKHRTLIPSFEKIGKVIVKCRYVIIIIVLILIVPSYIGSQKNNYLYGDSGMISEEMQLYKDKEAITEIFGKDNQIVLLLPIDTLEKEGQLIQDLNELKPITSINSIVTTFGIDAPIEHLPENIIKQFISEKYSRIILKIDLEEEGKETFDFIEELQTIVNKHYQDNYHMAGISPTNYDLMKIIVKDNLIVNVIAIIAIMIVLIAIFKSLLVPIILIIAIEVAILINLAIAYLSGLPLNYIGFLIVSIVQLGATVDYAILFAKQHRENRISLDKMEATTQTISKVAPSILSSAIILAIAGLGLGLISTNKVISQLGILVGRGAIISAVMVLLFVPSMLIICDKLINKNK